VGDSVTDVITVRYFAGARAATGIDEEQLLTDRSWAVDDLAEHLAQRHGEALRRILAAASFLVDETAAGRDRLVPAGSIVDVLPPFAGG
jgi:molybdopterin synthase sulfur carrier subunit